MQILNENNQELSLSRFVVETVNAFNSGQLPSVSEQEAMEALGECYYQSNLIGNQLNFKNNNYSMPAAAKEVMAGGFLKRLWNWLLDAVCPLIDENTEREALAEKIALAVGKLVPLGKLIDWLLKKIITYFLEFGYQVVCTNR